MIDFDLTELSDEDFEELRAQVNGEQERRYTIRNAERFAESIAERYAMAIGRQDGDEWVQPTGAHDAYAKGAIVSLDGKEWESTTPINVWKPGVSSGWRPLETVDSETAEWIQPTGGHDSYNIGDRVTFQGEVWQSTIASNVWSPADYPQGWNKVHTA